jgi:hypothetical protein
MGDALTRSDAVYHEYASAGMTRCGRQFSLTERYSSRRSNWVLRKNAAKFARPCKACQAKQP